MKNVIELNRSDELAVTLIQITDQLAAVALQPLTQTTREKMNSLARRVADLTISPQ